MERSDPYERLGLNSLRGLVLALVATLVLGLGACRDDDTLGDKVEDAGDEIEEAADDLGDELDEAQERIENAGEELEGGGEGS